MIFDFHPYCSVSSVLSSELTTCHMVTTCFISHAVSASHFLYNTSELGHQAVVWIKLYFLMMIIFLGGKKPGNLSDSVRFRAELCALWHLSLLSLSVEVWDDFRVSCIVSESQRFGHLNATLPLSSRWCFYYTCRHGDQHPLPHILLHL